jgi:hypothetical protein
MFYKSQFLHLQRLKIVFHEELSEGVIPHSRGRIYVLIKHHRAPEQNPWIFHTCTSLHLCTVGHGMWGHNAVLCKTCTKCSVLCAANKHQCKALKCSSPIGSGQTMAKTTIGICCTCIIKVQNKILVSSESRKCVRMERHVYQRTVVDIELAHYTSPSNLVGLVQRSLRHLMECRLF